MVCSPYGVFFYYIIIGKKIAGLELLLFRMLVAELIEFGVRATRDDFWIADNRICLYKSGQSR